MDAMSRPRPPYLHRETTRHGAGVWYVRVGKGPRIRIREPFGTPEFMAAYHAAVTGDAAAPRKPKESAGTLSWLIARYRDSGAWAALSPATKRQRENIFLHVIEKAGSTPAGEIEKRHIRQGIEDRKATPFAAGNFLKSMRGLFRWATEAGLIESDPTDGIQGRAPKTEGFHTWTEEEIDRFEACWPIGTRERLALTILLYTGLRRGDAARLGRQHVRNGVIMLTTEKTGAKIVVPLLPELAAVIEATKTGDLAFIAKADGAGMAKEGFGNWFRDACKAAAVPGSAHGLRKAGATRAANNGATVAQLEAIYGWSGGKMAALYTRAADRERLARQAMRKLSRDDSENKPKPAPEPHAPAPILHTIKNKDL
jgi:integrase